MGHHTELQLGVWLDKDTPGSVIETLEFMCGQRKLLSCTPSGAFFKHHEWESLLRCCDDMFPLSFGACSIKDCGPFYRLEVRCTRNHNDGELDAFLAWIGEHVYLYDTDEPGCQRYVGTLRAEDEEIPRLLFWKRDSGAQAGHIYERNIIAEAMQP